MNKKNIGQISFLILFLILVSCKKSSKSISSTTINPVLSTDYTTNGSKILKKNNPIQLIGVNAFHAFSAGGSDTKAWNIDIIREFIGNMKECPVSGGVIKDQNGAYLYSLQTIVDSNRSHNQITILCPFGWDGKDSTAFTGTIPSKAAWWMGYQAQIKNWAIQFKDQPDVWIEVYNEPYRYDRADGFTDNLWLSDMNSMVSLIRNSGNNNMILIPCAEQGQDESVLLNQGIQFLMGKSNILFDIHAYEKWLLVPNIEMGSRLDALKRKNLPVLFGETGPKNAGLLMNPQPFLDSTYQRGISVIAWAWNSSDMPGQDALFTSAGLPNDNMNNYWGTSFKNLALKVRNP